MFLSYPFLEFNFWIHLYFTAAESWSTCEHSLFHEIINSKIEIHWKTTTCCFDCLIDHPLSRGQLSLSYFSCRGAQTYCKFICTLARISIKNEKENKQTYLHIATQSTTCLFYLLIVSDWLFYINVFPCLAYLPISDWLTLFQWSPAPWTVPSSCSNGSTGFCRSAGDVWSQWAVKDGHCWWCIAISGEGA